MGGGGGGKRGFLSARLSKPSFFLTPGLFSLLLTSLVDVTVGDTKSDTRSFSHFGAEKSAAARRERDV